MKPRAKPTRKSARRPAAKPTPTSSPAPLDLKDPAVQRRHLNLHIDSFLAIATKAGFAVECVYMDGGSYQMRRRGPKEVTVLIDGQNVVKEIKG